METIKVKEEVIEVIEVIEEEEDTDQMTFSQFSLSRRNISDSDSPPNMIMQWKPLETKMKPDWTLTRLTHETNQASSEEIVKSVSHKRERALVDQFYDHLEAESSSVMEQAKEIQAKLAPEFPCFIQTMRPSYISDRFGMRFPREFCCLHLPPNDATVNLADERGEENVVNIHMDRNGRCGVSGGWKKFSIANKLLEGDVLVFQLVNPSNFKVHIVRANGPAERNSLETKMKPDWTLKRLSIFTHNTKQQASSDDMEKFISHKRERTSVDQRYDHLEADSPVMEQAKEIQAKLAPEFPSFIKTMRQSYVTDRYGIRFPREFCCLHLPPNDATVNLANERGEENVVNIHMDRNGRCGASGGWKKFSIANKLLEGDVLVFQLVNPSKFKVHIVRANGPAEVNSFVTGMFVSYKGRGASVDQFYNDLEAKSPVIERAKEIQANLAPEFPSFIKTMVPSNVTRRFGMRLPKDFCCLHLPPHDTTVHLVDESGIEYIVNINVEVDGRSAISGGWKQFSIANKLLEGDVVVFQLVNPSKFKVYIVSANGLTKGEGALGLLNLDSHANQSNFNDHADERIVSLLPMDIVPEKIQQESPVILKNYLADKPEIDSEDLGSAMPDFVVDSMEMGKVENFTIFWNGSIIKSELSEDHRTKYYELCCTRKSFLHNHLLETISCKLAVEIISETVNIADAIRACKLSTPRAEYLAWDKTLEGFELLGMDVGFLRDKIGWLLSLAFDSKEAVDSKRFSEAKAQQSCAIYEIRTLELKRLDLKRVVKRLDLEMETLKVSAERHELMFQEAVNAPWL